MTPRRLWAGLALVSTAGLAVELLHTRAHDPYTEALLSFFSLSQEQNLPTWVASVLLFSCGQALCAIARDASAQRRRWWLLAAGFFWMSLDEVAELHESLGGWWGGSGLFYFDWVLLAGPLVVVLGLFYLPFLRALPPRHRWRFVGAGALYVGGAVLMELPLGWWTERYGADGLGYALIDWAEETLELAGAGSFWLSLAALRAEAR